MLSIAIIALLLVGATGFAIASIRALAEPDSAHDMPARRRFLAEFDGVPANLLVETYEAIGRRLSAPGQRVTRDARLGADLALTAADIEDIALLVTARCDGQLPTAADLNRLDRSVETVSELIGFLRPFCAPGQSGRSHRAPRLTVGGVAAAG